MKFLKAALLSTFAFTASLQADDACDKKSLVIHNATVLNSQANDFVSGKTIIIDQLSGTISRLMTQEKHHKMLARQSLMPLVNISSPA